MKKYLDDAKEELKRADHLLYVSLKYTRTADVIMSVIKRLVTAYDAIMDALLEYALKKKKIKTLPTAPAMKANILKEVFKDNEKIVDNMDFYLLLRKVIKARKITKREEYRRHVTMTAHITSTHKIEINTDLLKEHYFKTKDFLEYLQEEIIK